MAYSQYPRGNAGVAQPGTIQVPAGSHPVVLVIILSIIFGGWVGMLVNRQIVKGIVYGFIITGILSVLTCGVGAIVLYPLTVIDAIIVATKLNRGQPIKEWQFF